MNDIYSAKLVSFDYYSLLFDINNLEPSTEEYRLIKIFEDNKIYDLINSKRYYLLNIVNDLIVDEDLSKIRPNIKYVYNKIPFLEIYEDLKKYQTSPKGLEEFLDLCLKNIDELNSIISSNDKIINIDVIRRLTKDRKF